MRESESARSVSGMLTAGGRRAHASCGQTPDESVRHAPPRGALRDRGRTWTGRRWGRLSRLRPEARSQDRGEAARRASQHQRALLRALCGGPGAGAPVTSQRRPSVRRGAVRESDSTWPWNSSRATRCVAGAEGRLMRGRRFGPCSWGAVGASRRRIKRDWSTATSSRATSWSRRMGRRGSQTLGWPWRSLVPTVPP